MARFGVRVRLRVRVRVRATATAGEGVGFEVGLVHLGLRLHARRHGARAPAHRRAAQQEAQRLLDGEDEHRGKDRSVSKSEANSRGARTPLGQL